MKEATHRPTDPSTDQRPTNDCRRPSIGSFSAGHNFQCMSVEQPAEPISAMDTLDSVGSVSQCL